MGNCHPLVQSIFLLCHPCHKKKIFIAEQYIILFRYYLSLYKTVVPSIVQTWIGIAWPKSKTWKVNERNRRSFFLQVIRKVHFSFQISSKLKVIKRMFNISTYTISVCFIWYMNAHILLRHKTLLAGTLSIKAFLSMLSACALYVVCTRLTQRWVSWNEWYILKHTNGYLFLSSFISNVFNENPSVIFNLTLRNFFFHVLYITLTIHRYSDTGGFLVSFFIFLAVS